MGKIKLIVVFFFCFFKTIQANEIETYIILENCKSCHGQNYEGNRYFKSLKKTGRLMFELKMKEYKRSKKNSVMSIISRALGDDDIKKMADFIYSEKINK